MRKIFKISSSFVRMYIINIMNIPRNRIYRVRCVRFILRILFFHVILLKYRQDLKDIQIDDGGNYLRELFRVISYCHRAESFQGRITNPSRDSRKGT